ncbi:nascent polypeptide-associated complex protein [Candidatus Aciduliprofundum boonei]|uniref:Nascent polypeptide-associated complex protein n=1 Tax=Aciduliprofundum boonei (strain DSM 19572 / T469) TaxID=439481 RepID=B5IA43_ACIB4|nr:nascent polypeptide-associated complex protein [Candidatus Aciduliprofundum boonei]ADD08323.1 ubiquitin-associated- domain-containing protein [Aciduliprofundum boonei T469]EDY34766.1 UBA/TS-N domain protein [Aciduliprofundum boonei T469]EDY37030.1 UBA/TS-N domain protein [Aciduliprofundum boonei T469]HII54667.1 ubiquitin [Candidatus Aciduliprofundum boonei]
MINPREMRRLMRQLKAKEIDAYEVIIKARDGDYVVEDPQVMAMEIQGQKMLQVVGELKKIEKKEEKEELPYTDEDIQLVMQQTGCTEEEARKALEEANGEPAEAIISIMSKR